MKRLQARVLLSLIAVVLLISLPSQDVLAKVDSIHKYEMQCPPKSGFDYCTPTDCIKFCSGKDGFTCKAGIFEGSWLVRIACCGCDSTSTPSAKTCRSNADCRSSEVCSPVYSPEGTKMLTTPSPSREQLEPPRPKTYRCVPKRVMPQMQRCTSSAQCLGDDYMCYNGRCVAY
jgi:hypothetical protein